MAEPLSVTMLRNRRDRIRDAIAGYEKALGQAQADLAHVTAIRRHGRS
jgi:F0F1-type ATP synthase membrane subunit b/b'